MKFLYCFIIFIVLKPKDKSAKFIKKLHFIIEIKNSLVNLVPLNPCHTHSMVNKSMLAKFVKRICQALQSKLIVSVWFETALRFQCKLPTNLSSKIFAIVEFIHIFNSLITLWLVYDYLNNVRDRGFLQWQSKLMWWLCANN